MVRTQAQLTEEQVARLKEIAAERGVSVAELIRRGVQHVIAAHGGVGREERRSRAIAAAGAFGGGPGNASVDHDAELAGIYATRSE